jgi:hypothetical protein
LDLSNVDVYQCSFEQFGDTPAFELDKFDISTTITNAASWLFAYLYHLHVMPNDRVSLHLTSDMSVANPTANKLYRLRRAFLNEKLDGRRDGFFVQLFFGLANTIEDFSMKVWVKEDTELTGG